MAVLSQTSLKWLFHQLLERQKQNLVPLCTLCKADADSRQGDGLCVLSKTIGTKCNDDVLPAEFMCRNCLTTLCSKHAKCSPESHQKTHLTIPLKYVFYNIFSAGSRSFSSPCSLPKDHPKFSARRKTLPASVRSVKTDNHFSTSKEIEDNVKVNRYCREIYPLNETHDLKWPYGLSLSNINGNVYIANT